jgi:hypothetical protein
MVDYETQTYRGTRRARSRCRHRLSRKPKGLPSCRPRVRPRATKARKACGDDDSAFGAWLAAHHLDKVPKNDRSALLNLAAHAKIATRVLRETTSRSVRLIWENEVRPMAYPRPYPNVGIGQGDAARAPVIAISRVAAISAPPEPIPIHAAERASVERIPGPVGMPGDDFHKIRQRIRRSKIADAVAGIVYEVQTGPPIQPDDLDAIVALLLRDGEPVHGFKGEAFRQKRHQTATIAALDLAAELCRSQGDD